MHTFVEVYNEERSVLGGNVRQTNYLALLLILDRSVWVIRVYLKVSFVSMHMFISVSVWVFMDT